MLFSNVLAAEPAEHCHHSGLTVVGTTDEAASACKAVGAVLRYFAAGGIAVDLQLGIRFRRAVFVEVTNTVTNAVDLLPVSGQFRARRNEIQIVGFGSTWKHQRRPWRLTWNDQLAESILYHEIVHAVVSTLMGASYRKLPRAWHEAIAYAVQIDLMDGELRQQVLAQYPDQDAFSSTLQINDLVYGVDPDAFAIAAYKTYVRDGKFRFFRKALALELEVIDVNDLIP